jgi:hypothetical protein
MANYSRDARHMLYGFAEEMESRLLAKGLRTTSATDVLDALDNEKLEPAGGFEHSIC